jgi:cysteinyl-tRNA synthetase
MDDDFNTASATAALFDIVKLVNMWLKRGSEENRQNAALPPAFFDAAENALRKIDGILGVAGIGGNDDSDEEDAEIARLIEERGEARKTRDFKRSDEIRDLLLARGVILEDTPHGTKWKRKLEV